MKQPLRSGVFFFCFIFPWLGATKAKCQSGGQLVAEVNRKTGFLEIRNGLVGIALPWERAVNSGNWNYAPIQSFIYGQNIYSDNTLNLLKAATAPVYLKTSVVRKSESEIAVKLEYGFQKKENGPGQEKIKTGMDSRGFYSCLVTVRKSEEIIVIEEDANYDIEYGVKISNGLYPDKARYRGWQSTSVKDGYEAQGMLYRSEDARGYPMDATVDLDYSRPYTFPRLSLWDPPGGEINTGRYWILYNSLAETESVILGFFQGKPSRLIGAHHVGPSLRLLPQDPDNNEKKTAELFIKIDRRAPDNIWHPRKRYQWAVYISTKKNLKEPRNTQPIGLALNKVAGIGENIKSYVTKPARLMPSFYTGGIYMESEKIARLQQSIRNSDKVYRRICELEPGYKAVWDSWYSIDSAKSLLRQLKELKTTLEDQYRSGEGIYQSRYRYWKGVLNYKYYAICASALFSNKAFPLSLADKKELEQLVVLMARILWDDNNVPLFDSAGVNFGPANMPFQYRNTGRFFFALMLANDPEFSARARKVPAAIKKDIDDAIHTNGASFGSPHYTQATIDPILFSALQLKQSGLGDLFKTEPKITAFAKFYLSMLTPASCRFEGKRKIISFGDGAEESVSTFGLLATGLGNVNKTLSEELAAAYFNGPPRFSYAGPMPLAVDVLNNVEKKLSVANSNFSGYLSHFRSAENQKFENAFWILNGDRYSDHRHDDAGQVAIYALGAPLSLSSSSFYYPAATDSRIKSVVVPEKIFPEWTGQEQPINSRSLTNRTWPVSGLIEFANLGPVVLSKVLMRSEDKSWFRTVVHFSLHDDMPGFIFYDSVAGYDTNIWSIPMMSQGHIKSPAGLILPEKRMHNTELQQLPKPTDQKNIPAGWNEFQFTGQEWKSHFSNGINWQLFIYSSQPTGLTVSHWGTTWQNSTEKDEFKKTNGRSYTEEQQILRLKFQNSLMAVLLPYIKSAQPYQNLSNGKNAGFLKFRQKEDEITIGPDFLYVRSNGEEAIFLLGTKGNWEKDGIHLKGGVMSLQVNDSLAVVRVHGASGKRSFSLPVRKLVPITKYQNLILKSSGNTTQVAIDYSNINQDLMPGEKGYKEFVFKIEK
jgi:hypothetical protein